MLEDLGPAEFGQRAKSAGPCANWRCRTPSSRPAASLGGLTPPEYRRMNPNRKVPLIDDGGFILWESNAIVRYLRARYGEGAISPADPGGAGAAPRCAGGQPNEPQPTACCPPSWAWCAPRPNSATPPPSKPRPARPARSP